MLTPEIYSKCLNDVIHEVTDEVLGEPEPKFIILEGRQIVDIGHLDWIPFGRGGLL